MMRMVRLLGFGVIVCITVSLIVVLWLCAVRAVQFAHPARFPVNTTPAEYGFQHWREVTLTTSDNLNLSAWFILPETTLAKNPVILFVHGIDGNRLQFMEEAQWLTQQGYAVLLFDLRNHGSSEGTLTTMGLREVNDVKAAFAYLISQPEVDTENITLFGHSMGGVTAILAMAELPQVKALIIDTAYTSLIDVINDGVRNIIGTPFGLGDVIMFMTNVLTGENLYAVRPVDVIAAIAPRPIYMMHGTADPTIPASHTVALYEKAHDPKFLWLVEGGVHGNLYEIAEADYQARLLRFLSGTP
jgi:uncharacterized protein